MARIKKIPKVPIHGKAAHNAAFLTAIGGLVVNWSNNESVFLAMLQLLVLGGPLTAAIVWQTQRTSKARVELVGRLCRERLTDIDLLNDINKAISRFQGLSRVRNFYSHATYTYSSDLNLKFVQGATTPQEGAALTFETKRMDRATLNEIGHASVELAKLNRALWTLVIRLQDTLGVRLQLPPAVQAAGKPNPNAPSRQGKGAKPPKPQ